MNKDEKTLAVIIIAIFFLVWGIDSNLFSVLGKDEDFVFVHLTDDKHEEDTLGYFTMGNMKITSGDLVWTCATPEEQGWYEDDCWQTTLKVGDVEETLKQGEKWAINDFLTARFQGKGFWDKREGQMVGIPIKERSFFFDVKPDALTITVDDPKELVSLGSTYSLSVDVTNHLPSADFILESKILKEGFMTETFFVSEEFKQDEGLINYMIDSPTDVLGEVKISLLPVLIIKKPADIVTLDDNENEKITSSSLSGTLIFAGDSKDVSYTVKQYDALYDYSDTFVPFKNKIVELAEKGGADAKTEEKGNFKFVAFGLVALALILLIVLVVKKR